MPKCERQLASATKYFDAQQKVSRPNPNHKIKHFTCCATLCNNVSQKKSTRSQRIEALIQQKEEERKPMNHFTWFYCNWKEYSACAIFQMVGPWTWRTCKMDDLEVIFCFMILPLCVVSVRLWHSHVLVEFQACIILARCVLPRLLKL